VTGQASLVDLLDSTLSEIARPRLELKRAIQLSAEVWPEGLDTVSRHAALIFWAIASRPRSTAFCVPASLSPAVLQAAAKKSLVQHQLALQDF
jgi:hypothetical protein